ncbi:MAG: hypothetical protein ABI833_02400 [Acidobacteriota bacterium]
MSTATLQSAAGISLSERTRSRWIISQRQDLIWFIGSALISYLALGLMTLGVGVALIQFIWFFGIDGPHVQSTITRTYFDKAERARLGWFLWIPVPLLLWGPAMVWAGGAGLFFLFAVCWQQFHIVKQHFGFMMLYKAKNKDRDRTDFLLDRWLLLSSLLIPLGMFVLRTQPIITNTFPLLAWIPSVAIGVYGLLAIVWLLRQAQKLRAGAPMNRPKLGLLLTVIPLQWLALLSASHYGPDGILRAGITLGLFHSFQYHRLMWFHNRNRYTEPGALERHGLAARLVSNVGVYLAIAIGLNLVLNFIPSALLPYQTAQAAVWGVAFTHYCMDARIWRVRSDKGLAAALRMA